MEKIQAAVLTLNEGNHIADTVRSILDVGVSTVVVLDGGSVDDTVSNAERAGAIVRTFPRTSIGFRRAAAASQCVADFLLFVDADQSLSNLDIPAIIERYFAEDRVAGIQFTLRAVSDEGNYWERGFDYRHRLLAWGLGPRKVIGTPCIYRMAALRDSPYRADLQGPNDDTALGHQLTSSGYTLLRVCETATEAVRNSLGATMRKAFWYGLGDAEFVRATRSRKVRYNHVQHVVLRNLLLAPLITLWREPPYVSFMVIFGTARSLGFFSGLLLRPYLASKTS